MNYIKEINAFYVEIETNPLSANAGMLWHTLLHMNNRTRWIKEFSVAAMVLCYKSGLSNSSFKRARTELTKKGYISFRSRSPQAAMYQIISLVNKADAVVVSAGKNQSKKRRSESGERSSKNEKMIAVMNNKTFLFYQEHLGEPNAATQDEMIEWTNKMGNDLMYEALKRAVKNKKVTWPYVQAILNNWHEDGLVTVIDIHLSEEKYHNKRAKSYRSKRGHRHEEVIPDWFREMKEKERVGREA